MVYVLSHIKISEPTRQYVTSIKTKVHRKKGGLGGGGWGGGGGHGGGGGGGNNQIIRQPVRPAIMPRSKKKKKRRRPARLIAAAIWQRMCFRKKHSYHTHKFFGRWLKYQKYLFRIAKYHLVRWILVVKPTALQLTARARPRGERGQARFAAAAPTAPGPTHTMGQLFVWVLTTCISQNTRGLCN